MIRLALYQPEIPHNTGTLMRMSACLGTHLDVIGPCGFILNDKHLRRSGMDYLDQAAMTLHPNYQSFLDFHHKRPHRLIALAPRHGTVYTEFAFQENDVILAGSEGDGLPHDVLETIQLKINIPMLAERRSLNLALACGIVMAEALRQLDGFPKGDM